MYYNAVQVHNLICSCHCFSFFLVIIPWIHLTEMAFLLYDLTIIISPRNPLLEKQFVRLVFYIK